MKKLLAIGLTCCVLPTGLAAEDQSGAFLGTVNVLVIEDSTPSRDMLCAGAGERTECMAFNRAVLTARVQKVSALHERGRWM